MRRVQLELDSGLRRSANGTVLMGGTPFRVLRLSAAGARLLDRWLAGSDSCGSTGAAEAPESAQAAALRDRLLAAGMVHPVVEPIPDPPSAAFVVPIHDDAHGLGELLAAIRTEHPDAEVVVVDDASTDAAAIVAVAGRHGAHVLRHRVNRGPGAARNSGWRSLAERPSMAPPEVVVFIDADVVPGVASIALLLAHLADHRVAAVAPRVVSRPGPTAIDRYESNESPLDLGAAPALVKPHGRVPYVPTATLAIRTAALTACGGFDESMRVGEDVDFVFRLVAGGGPVRYEPRAVVHHRNRASLAALVRQRHAYGTAAAPLAARHRGAVAPVALPAATFAAWSLAAFGGRRLRAIGVLVALADGVRLRHRLASMVDRPVREAVALSLRGHASSGHWLARSISRAWAPVFAALAVRSRRVRRVVALALVTPPLVAWLRDRPPLDPVRHLALRIVDDLAYCSGVWRGAWRERSVAALVPEVVPSGGRSTAAERR